MRTKDGVAATMLIGVGLLAALLSLPAAASVSQTRTPTAQQAASALAFVANGQPSKMYSDEYGIYQVYVVNLDERRLEGLDTPLTPRDGDADSPSWSPDGQRIVYSFSPKDSDASYLEVINADGSDRQRLTQGGAESAPAWSPDGKTIAYVTLPDGAIYVMDADGGNARLLHEALGAVDLDWSPDGAQLLITTRIDGLGDVYLISADGSNVRRLLSGSQAAHSAAWSPDGQRIAYAVGHDIYLTGDEGKTSRRLELSGFFLFALDADSAPTFMDLDWSPSGRELAASVWSWRLQIAVSTPVPLERVGWQLMIVDVETGEARPITYGFDNRAPDWRPAPEGSLR